MDWSSVVGVLLALAGIIVGQGLEEGHGIRDEQRTAHEELCQTEEDRPGEGLGAAADERLPLLGGQEGCEQVQQRIAAHGRG